MFPEGHYALKTKLVAAIEEPNNELSSLCRELFMDLFLQFNQIDKKVSVDFYYIKNDFHKVAMIVE